MTFRELQAAGFVEHHRCGFCGHPVGFKVHPQFAAACFDATCNCVTGNVDSYRLLTHSELASIPNRDVFPPSGKRRA